MRYKIVNVVAFAILNAFTLRKEEDEDFVVGGVLLLTVVLFKDDEKRAVDKDATEFETIIIYPLGGKDAQRTVRE